MGFDKDRYIVLDITGEIKYISTEMSYISPRLQPDVRSRLEEVGKCQKEYNRVIEEKKKVLNRAIKKVEKENKGPLLSQKKFDSELCKRLKEKFKTTGYNLEYYYDYGLMTIELCCNRLVSETISHSIYPFLKFKQGNPIVIDKNTKSYNMVLAKERENCLYFSVKEPLELQEEMQLYVSKDKLYLMHNVCIECSKYEYSIEFIEKVLNSIKVS